MLFSPRSLLSAVVASLVLASATNAAVLQARQSAAARTTTCTYTWSCDSTQNFTRVSAPGESAYLRCNRAAMNSPNGNMTACYYPNKGGDAATGEPTHYSDTLGANRQYCPDYGVRSSTDSSCSSVQRRAVNTGPVWAVSRQAVVRKDADGNKKVVPQAKSTGRDWRSRR